MNSCVLMVRVLDAPQLRYTQDNQTEVADMMVEFDSVKAEDAPSRLKVVAWRNLAQEVKEKYRPGDQLVIQGSLRMSVFERKEGFKEKRAELTASRIYKVGEVNVSNHVSTATTKSPNNVVSIDSYKPSPTETEYQDADSNRNSNPTDKEPVSVAPQIHRNSDLDDQNLDDIPF